MKTDELRKNTIDELKQKAIDLCKELFMFRMRRSSGNETKTHLIPQIKKNLARVKTIQREKERSAV